MTNVGKYARWGGILTFFVFCVIWVTHSFGGKEPSQMKQISLQRVADYVHAVIEADRTVYTTHVVNRLQEAGIIEASEHWEQQKALPLPAQFLNAAGRLVAKSGNGIRYRLISLWPIYRRNGPATNFERQGLEALMANPENPYSGIVKTGQKEYFQAIYADKAIANACISCHNNHPLSPKRDFKLDDVLGGIVITIPLDN